MYGFPHYFAIIDTEFWANKGSEQRNWKGRGEFPDLIDIGGVVANGQTFDLVTSFSFLIKPTLRLTEYITNLTGITQEMVDEAQPFSQVLPLVELITRGLRIYGGEDEVIRANCKRYDVGFRFNVMRCTDLISIVGPLVREIDPTPRASGELIQAFGISGRPAHRGMNDSYNQLLVLQELRKRGRL